MVARLDAILRATESTLIVILTLIGLGMAFLQVILRYVFNTGIHWLEAGLVTALVWAMLIGAVRAVREGLHPRVDLLPTLVPAKFRALLNVAALAATLALMIYFLLDSIFYARFLNRFNALHPELGIKQLYPFLIIPIVTALMTLRYGLLAWALWFRPDALSADEQFRHLINPNPADERVQ